MNSGEQSRQWFPPRTFTEKAKPLEIIFTNALTTCVYECLSHDRAQYEWGHGTCDKHKAPWMKSSTSLLGFPLGHFCWNAPYRFDRELCAQHSQRPTSEQQKKA